jgi:hypothetical protein
VDAVQQAGGWLEPKGGYIKYQVPAQSALLLEELRCHKRDVLRLLEERKRRKDFAYLLPFLGKRVWTPAGRGTLVRLAAYATVQLEDSRKLRWYDPTGVIPYA